MAEISPVRRRMTQRGRLSRRPVLSALAPASRCLSVLGRSDESDPCDATRGKPGDWDERRRFECREPSPRLILKPIPDSPGKRWRRLHHLWPWTSTEPQFATPWDREHRGRLGA
jgi:hypothetical protein